MVALKPVSNLLFAYEDLENRSNFCDCKDLNRSGLRRFSMSPLASKLFYLTTSTHVKVQDDLTNYIIPSGVGHHPDNWCGNLTISDVTFNKSLFDYLLPKFKKDLQNKKAWLFLDQSLEGYQTVWLWDWFHLELSNNNIPPSQIIYITGNLLASTQYNEWCLQNNVSNKMLVVPFSTFEHDTSLALVHTYALSWETQVNYKKLNTNKIYAFSALQKRPRRQRIEFFVSLIKHSLLQHGIISMNEFDLAPYEFDPCFDQISNECKRLPILPPESKYTSKDMELNIFTSQDSGNFVQDFNIQTHLNTWVCVTSESSYYKDEVTCFLSEKTFKPIACHQPFIILGAKNSLEYLRQAGYKTFSPYIDESYDELDDAERMEAIARELEKFKMRSPTENLEWFLGVEDIVRHNYNVLHSKHTTPLEEILQKVQKHVSI